MSGPLLVRGAALQQLAADLDRVAAALSRPDAAGPGTEAALQPQVADALRAFDRNWAERRHELQQQLRSAADSLRVVDCTFTDEDTRLSAQATRT